MSSILGLDLGTNSIGYCIRNTQNPGNQFEKFGVLTFEKGVSVEKGSEHPKVQQRTEARGKRRNYQAEKYRKWELLKFLIKKKWCPLTIDELNKWKKYEKGQARQYPQSPAFIQWLRFDFDGDGKPDFARFGFSIHENCYLFRMLAISNQAEHRAIFKDHPEILARIFYQLVQRRGFRGREEEDAKTMLEGNVQTRGRNAISNLIDQHGSLGAALYYAQKTHHQRIRKRYNLRADFEQELKRICEVQNLTEEDYKHLWKAIIWQRTLRSQKGLVGLCTFETKKTRCPVSHPDYEAYRTWVVINNLKIALPKDIDRPTYLAEKIFPLFLNASPEFKLSKIVKVLKKDGGSIESKFNSSELANGKISDKGENETKLLSCTLSYSLKELFGDNWRNYKKTTGRYKLVQKKDGTVRSLEITYDINDIWHVLQTFDDKEKLKSFGHNNLGLSEEQAEKFSAIKLTSGYATLSRSAIHKIIPHLIQGNLYSHAVYLANIPKVLGTNKLDSKTDQAISSELKKIIEEDTKEKLINQVINGLIGDQLNSETRFGMCADYQLDEDDEQTILQKINAIIREYRWRDWSQAQRENALATIRQKYLTFLQKPISYSKQGVFEKQERLHDKVFSFLKLYYQAEEKNKKYLWHPAEQESYRIPKIYHQYTVKERAIFVADVNIEKFLARNPQAINNHFSLPLLGDPQPISRGFKNPMALKSLHKLKGLINHLLRTGQIDEDTRIVIEIARELNDANRRKAIEKWQKDRELENNRFKKEIISGLYELNQEVIAENSITNTMLDRYRLWIEQNRQCLYTGNIIGLKNALFGGQYNLEHTIPASLSFDNELKNLTLADENYNKHIKGKLLPSQLPNYHRDVNIHGVFYSAFEPRLEFMKQRIAALKANIERNLLKSKYASTKERKDEAIMWRHYHTENLKYWQKKLWSFTIDKFEPSWRNSQLRDTQIITKYALPYLKTIFKKVDVQKPIVVTAFKEIYQVKLYNEIKDRNTHNHHTEDAAILTLIPSAKTREKILEQYFTHLENKTSGTYHAQPQGWPEFQATTILNLRNEILVNNMPEYRETKITKKKVRKRGKIEPVTITDASGNKTNKKDAFNNQIAKIATGTTLRGKLHDDTFYAKTKMPLYEEKNGKFLPITDGKGNFIFEQNEKRGDEYFFTSRHMQGLSYFNSIEDFDLIVDKNLAAYLRKFIPQLMAEKGLSFKEAMQEEIYAFGKKVDKNNHPISPIRHIRSKIKAGGGYVLNPPIINQFNAYVSEKKYKQFKYAMNSEGSIIGCGFYQAVIDNQVVRELKTTSLLQLSEANRNKLSESLVEETLIIKHQKKDCILPLYARLKPGQKVIFYASNLAELKSLSVADINKRMYIILNFETDRIRFRHHLVARSELKYQSVVNLDTPHPLLRLSKGALNFAIEGKHFTMAPDAIITWQI